MSVLLPAPFSPTRPWISPGARSSETSSLASTGPKRRVTWRIETAGGAALPGGVDMADGA
jgi:hypothetical protein